LARKTVVAASRALGADGIGKETAGRALVENVHGIDPITCSRVTHQHSSPAPQSAPHSTQHMPPASHITPSCNINDSKKKMTYVPLYPPANMANPWFGSDVAACHAALATLRAAVVQRPLVASKMSTTLLKALPVHVQRISIHFQHQSEPLFTQHKPPDSHITPSCNINKYEKYKQNNIRTACPAACEYG
jgi:hypothetical protein